MIAMLRSSIFYLLIICIFATLPDLDVFGKETTDFRLRAHSKSFAGNITADDVRAEVSFGRELSARIFGNLDYYDNKKLNKYVGLVGHVLLEYAGRQELTFHFAILDAEYINAYSAPGGYIFITLGALNMMSDEAELAAVLAHEIAHITQRHIVNDLRLRAADQSVVSSLSSIIGGSSKTVEIAFSQAVEKAVSILFKTGYRIEQETEADSVATLMLASAGYDPTALKRFLKKIDHKVKNKTRKAPTTHPLTDERLNSIDLLITEEKLTAIRLPTLMKRFNENINLTRQASKK